MDENRTDFHAGFVAVLGKPNVGKSTLINALLGRKIAAASPWPQTTRKRQMGILTLPNAQVVFVDTPGIHKPHHKLGKHMNEEAADVLAESDLALFLVDGSLPPTEEDKLLAEVFNTSGRHLSGILALNKIDLIATDLIPEYERQYVDLLPTLESIPVSAAESRNLDQLVERIITHLPLGAPYFPEDQITDLYERDIAADLIREAVLNNVRDEVPHAVAVRIDEYRERDTQGAYIAATLFVERESQIGILVGQGGSMLKKIGAAARHQIEAMSERKVFLELRVKVRKNWRNDESSLKLFGFGS